MSMASVVCGHKLMARCLNSEVSWREPQQVATRTKSRMRSRTRRSQIGLFLICFYLCFLGGVMLQCLWSWDFSKFLLPIGRNLPEQYLIVIYALPFWKPYSCVWEMLFLRCGKTTLNVTYWCLSQGIKHASFTGTTTTMDKSNLII